MRFLSRRASPFLAAACACCAAGSVLGPAALAQRSALATVTPGAARPLHGRLDAAARAVEDDRLAP